MNIPEPGKHYRTHQGLHVKVWKVIDGDYVIYSRLETPFSAIFCDIHTGEYGQIIDIAGVAYAMPMLKSIAMSRVEGNGCMWGMTVKSWNSPALFGSHKDEKGILVYTQKPSFELIEDG